MGPSTAIHRGGETGQAHLQSCKGQRQPSRQPLACATGAEIGTSAPPTAYAVLCQGPYDESIRYRDFMGWDMPWYSAQASLDAFFVGRKIGLFHLMCYLRDGDRVFETYWTNNRGAEVMDYNYALMDLTAYGRQEPWEDSPPGWPQQWQVDGSNTRTNGRPIAQWSRLEAGRSDDLAGGP
ncbi:DUF899 family protein [Pseudonocardia sp.]|uniref:DUF899 family protein n=1 Tax=Pseudonocardia sp. TaxID=60912 RepID=UPI0031FBD475